LHWGALKNSSRPPRPLPPIMAAAAAPEDGPPPGGHLLDIFAGSSHESPAGHQLDFAHSPTSVGPLAESKGSPKGRPERQPSLPSAVEQLNDVMPRYTENSSVHLSWTTWMGLPIGLHFSSKKLEDKYQAIYGGPPRDMKPVALCFLYIFVLVCLTFVRKVDFGVDTRKALLKSFLTVSLIGGAFLMLVLLRWLINNRGLSSRWFYRYLALAASAFTMIRWVTHILPLACMSVVGGDRGFNPCLSCVSP